jgi:ABC-type dipeptide/oligopeptide/nickel transport system permease component
MFAWPGLGRALVSTLTDRGVAQWQGHISLMTSLMTVLAVLFLAANLVTDMAAMAVDPRLRRND